MARSYRHKEGERFGPWKLIEPLGAGGNAEVWRVADENANSAALKILKSLRSDSEPYKRFSIETVLLRSLSPWTGVLPILDAYLPEEPHRQDPAWLAMPIATPIRKALVDRSGLPVVVEAIAEIADVLVSLLAAKGISHRDIKPDNLYQYEGKWAIGDFGLADYPEKEALTADGQKLGPLYFLAPEMITNPRDADGSLADVYSLAKTLWVLATDQNYPPQGEQRVDIAQLRIGAYVSDSRTNLLDRLIEHATKYDPNARPSMKQFAEELRAWLAPRVEVASTRDLSDLFGRIAAAAEPGDRADKLRLEQISLAQELLSRIKERIHPVVDAFNKTGRGVWTLDTEREGYVSVNSPYRREHYQRTDIPSCTIFRRYYGPGITLPGRTPAEERPSQMIGEVGLILFEDGMIELHGQYFFFLRERPALLPPPSDSIHFCSARVGSARQEFCVDAVINHMIESLPSALEYLATLFEVFSS
jgi:serine/threonine protein kinase